MERLPDKRKLTPDFSKLLAEFQGPEIASTWLPHTGYAIMFGPRMNTIVDRNMQAGQEKFAQMLRDAKLRPTKQRVALAELLFSKGDRHLSAESLYDEAHSAGISVSLATIYNTLHQFTDNGLLKAISIDSNRTYFDTNTGSHYHFLDEVTNEVIDMPDGSVELANMPEPPAGREISGVDIVVRLRRLQN